MRTVRVCTICLNASFGIILILLTAAPPASAQLVNRDAARNWVDRPTDPVTQRRNVTYSIDDPPAGAPAGFVQAVRDAIAAWNAAQDYPGGIRLTQASDSPSSDIRVR